MRCSLAFDIAFMLIGIFGAGKAIYTLTRWLSCDLWPFYYILTGIRDYIDSLRLGTIMYYRILVLRTYPSPWVVPLSFS